VGNPVTVFSNSEQIYTVMQSLFERMNGLTPDPVDALVSSRMVVRIKLTEPEAQITINGRNRPVNIDYGSSNGRADLEIGMKAELLHLILLDEYSIKQGFSNGELKVRGPIWKALSFVDIFQKGRAYYPQVLEEYNLSC
jgi:hypothetical protein